MSKLKLSSFPKRITRDEIDKAKTANAIEAAQQSAAEQKKRIAALKREFDQYIVIFLDEWVNQANLAITRATRPADKRSHRSWFIALVGNLVWAGTVFVPAPAIVAALSFAGAAIGSGSVPEFEGSPQAPQDPKEVVTKKIHENYPRVESWFSSEAEDWAWEVDAKTLAGDAVIANRLKEYVWSKMFPKTEYATRHDKIYTVVKANMEAMLADYNAQWQAWISKHGLERLGEDATWFKIVMYKQEPFKPNLDKYWTAFSRASQ